MNVKSMVYYTIPVGTCNDDWASAGSNLELMQKHAHVIGIQEGKRAHYAKMVDAMLWLVVQFWTSTATAGCALVMHKHIRLNPRKKGIKFGVKAPGILGRYIVWQKCRPVVGKRRGKVVFIVCHWPPQRVKHWWNPYTLAVRVLVRSFKMRGWSIVLITDSNQHSHTTMERMLGLVWHSDDNYNIDGFLVTKDVKISKVIKLQKGTSDHNPLIATCHIPVVGRAA